jgi:hypothetical protein
MGLTALTKNTYNDLPSTAADNRGDPPLNPSVAIAGSEDSNSRLTSVIAGQPRHQTYDRPRSGCLSLGGGLLAGC